MRVLRFLRRHLVVTCVAGTLVLGGAGLAAWRLAHRPSQAHILFAELIPEWSARRHNGSGAPAALAAALDGARPWPAVEAALRDVDAVWPDTAGTAAAVARLNAAARDAGLRFHVDQQTPADRPVLLSYAIDGAAFWSLGQRNVEVLRVQRLDHLNIELGLAGHAGGDRPLVLLDRLETEIIDNLLGAYATKLSVQPPASATDAAVTRHWRGLMEKAVGEAALRRAAELLQARASVFDKMQHRMLRPSAGQLLLPGRFELGDRYFGELYDFADVTRPGGALIFSSDVGELEHADLELRAGEARRTLAAVLAIEALTVEAHEARHALDPLRRPAPAALAEVTGGLTPDFVRSAELELRAFLAQIVDAPVPPCLGVTRIAAAVRGARARPTPHFYAGWTLLREISGQIPDPESTPALVDAMCALSDADLRQRATAAHVRLYGEPFVPAKVRQAPKAHREH